MSSSLHQVQVPIERGAAINANDRLHYMERARRVAELRRRGYLFARSAKLPHLVRARLDVEVVRPRRVGDVANWHPTVKALLDGMVDAGVLTDDSDRYLSGPFLHAASETGKAGRLLFRFTFTEVGGRE